MKVLVVFGDVLCCSFPGSGHISGTVTNCRIMLFFTKSRVKTMLIFIGFIYFYLPPCNTEAIPTVNSAEFVNKYEEIIITFANTLALTSAEGNCQTLFKGESIQLLGGSPICKMKSNTELILTPSVSAVLSQNIKLKIIGNNSQEFTVTSPVGEVSPKLQLSDVKYSCLCMPDKLYFNLDKSYDLAYGPLKNIVWTLKEKRKVKPSSAVTGMSASISPSGINATLSLSVGNDSMNTVLQDTTITPIAIISTSTVASSSQGIVTPTPLDANSVSATSALKIIGNMTVQLNNTMGVIFPSPTSVVELTTYVPPPRPKTKFDLALDSQQGNVEISLDTSLLRHDAEYTLVASASNVLQKTSNISTVFEFKRDCVPHVDLLKSFSVHASPVIFSVKIIYPKCWNETALPKFSWKILFGGSLVDLGSTITTRTILVADESLFTKGTLYKVSVNVTVKTAKNGTSKISRSMNFILNANPLMVGILGETRIVGKNDTLRLESFIFSEPDNVPGTYEWLCQNTVGAACSEFGVPLKFSNAKVLEVNIKMGDFEAGKSYRFTLNYQKGGQVSTDNVLVTMINGTHASMVVYTKQKYFLHDENLLFTAELFGALKGSYSYEWNCFDPQDTTKTQLITDQESMSGSVEVTNDDDLTKLRLINLFLPRMPPNFNGYTITCRCVVTHDSVTYSATDSIVLSKSTHPLSFDVSPQTGTALETKFRIRAHGWIADDLKLPLLFRFGYISDDKLVKKKYLTGWTSSNILEDVSFPLFTFASSPFQLKVFVTVKNSARMLSYKEADITLTKPLAENYDKIAEKTKKRFLDNIPFDFFRASQDMYGLGTFFIEAKTNILSEYEKYVDFIMDSPVYWNFLKTALDVIRHSVNVQLATVSNENQIVVNKTLDVLNFLNGLAVSRNIHLPAPQVTYILNVLLNTDKYQKQVLPLVPGISKNLAQSMCSMMGKPHEYGDFMNVSSSVIDLLVAREHFLKSKSKTILALQNNMTNFDTWKCGTTDENCNGLCIAQLQYDRSVYLGWSNFTEKWILLTDVYDVSLWNPGTNKEISTTGESDYFDVILPVKYALVEATDNLYCQVLEGDERVDNTSICRNVRFVNNGANGEIHCRCQKLGKIAAFKEFIKIITTTESPNLGENMTFSLHFYAPKSMCLNAYKYGFFRDKVRKGLAKELAIKEERIIATTCDIGSVIVHLLIMDEIGERRNINLQYDLRMFIWRQDFSITMKDGTFDMFDVAQTTPKPPPPTIPPIGKVDTDWIPIGISIGVVIFVFLLCGIATYMIQTVYLKNKVFTGVNSDKIEELTPEEQVEMQVKSARERKMDDIMDEAITGSTTSLSKRSKRGSICPVDNSGCLATGLSYRSSVQLDELPRFALDDSSDEESTSRATSNATLFRASSVSVRLQDDGDAGQSNDGFGSDENAEEDSSEESN